MIHDPQTWWLFGGVLALLMIASITGRILKHTLRGEEAQRMVANLNARINAWWVMCFVFAVALAAGRIATVVMFAIISFLALREFITITPTGRHDHRALFWAFFVILPYEYWLVATDWYGMLAICIPVYAYLLIPIRNAIAGETQRFLERTSKIQWGLMVCVYFVSYAPALLNLQVPGYEKQNARLLFFLVVVVQASDVLQYIWGKCCGRHPIAPKVEPQQNGGGVHRRRVDGGGARHGALVDHAVQTVAGGGDVGGGCADGLFRRPGHVGDQARPRRERLRGDDSGARGHLGSHRFALLCGSGFLPSDTVFFHLAHSRAKEHGVAKKGHRVSPASCEVSVNSQIFLTGLHFWKNYLCVLIAVLRWHKLC